MSKTPPWKDWNGIKVHTTPLKLQLLSNISHFPEYPLRKYQILKLYCLIYNVLLILLILWISGSRWSENSYEIWKSWCYRSGTVSSRGEASWLAPPHTHTHTKTKKQVSPSHLVLCLKFFKITPMCNYRCRPAFASSALEGCFLQNGLGW